MEAARVDSKPKPQSINTTATSRPPGVAGAMSPYPTVVTAITAHYTAPMRSAGVSLILAPGQATVAELRSANLAFEIRGFPGRPPQIMSDESRRSVRGLATAEPMPPAPPSPVVLPLALQPPPVSPPSQFQSRVLKKLFSLLFQSLVAPGQSNPTHRVVALNRRVMTHKAERGAVPYRSTKFPENGRGAAGGRGEG